MLALGFVQRANMQVSRVVLLVMIGILLHNIMFIAESSIFELHQRWQTLSNFLGEPMARLLGQAVAEFYANARLRPGEGVLLSNLETVPCSQSDDWPDADLNQILGDLRSALPSDL